METLPVPLFTKTYKSIEEEELTDEGFFTADCFTTLNEKGGIRRRAAIESWKSLSQGNVAVDGIHWWDAKGLLMVACDGDLHAVYAGPDGTSNPTVTTISGAGYLVKNVPTAIVDNGTYCIAAAQGRIVYTDGTTLTVVADADAPVNVSHLVYLDTYILCNEMGSGRFYFCELGDITNWSPLDFAAGSSSPDNILALVENNRNIFLLGATTLELWENDGLAPFSRVAGGVEAYGIAGPYAVVSFKEGVYWLGNDRRFYMYKSGRVERLPSEFDRELADDFLKISDCIGNIIRYDNYTFLLFHFVQTDRTLVYCLETEAWQEWGVWDSQNLRYRRLPGQHAVYVSQWSATFIGSNKGDARVCKLSSTATSDYDSGLIRPAKITGHIDYGSSIRKRNRALRLRLKRGKKVTTTAPVLELSWRDDGQRQWSIPRQISLGLTGDHAIVEELHALGVYRTRQYMLTLTDAVDLTACNAEEDFDPLR